MIPRLAPGPALTGTVRTRAEAGALTPNEVARAWDLGAAAVKIFPANAFGPRYLRDLAEPFRDVRLLPTGGIGPDTAAGYIAAGAIAVGAGGSLIGDALDGGSLTALAGRARALPAAAAPGEAAR
ncbi:hypothetical protein ACQEU6_28345 [Spirillospora sp. CA-108201]